MSTVGLTKARQSALALLVSCRNADDFALALQAVGRTMLRALHAGKLIDDEGRPTKRGHAAIAAPRMTQAEYDALKWLSTYIVRYAIGHRRRMMRRLSSRGFANFDPFTGDASINDAGRTALNNVRAAMGSPDWKEGL